MNKPSPIRAWLSWAIATSFVIFQFLLQTAAGVMAHHWKIDFHINAVAVANLSAAFFYMYVFMQIPAGIVYDRFNPQFILTFAASTLALGCFLLSWTDNYYFAFFARALMGMGASFGFVGMLHISSTWFSAKAFPLIVSLAETIAAVSMTANVILLAVLVENFGWRHTMRFASYAALIIACLALIIIRAKAASNQDHTIVHKEPIWKNLLLLVKNKQAWLVGIYGFFSFTIINVFTSLWGIPLLTNVYHFSLSTSAQIVSMVFLGIASGTLSLSWLSMQIGRRKPILFFSAFITFILLSIVFFVPNLSETMIYAILYFSGFFSAAYVLTFTLIKELMPAHYRAAALAMTNTLMMISAPLLQPLVGFFISHQFFGLAHSVASSYRFSLALLPVGLAIATVLVFFMQESYCKELHEE